jgi:hypothetical protein
MGSAVGAATELNSYSRVVQQLAQIMTARRSSKVAGACSKRQRKDASPFPRLLAARMPLPELAHCGCSVIGVVSPPHATRSTNPSTARSGISSCRLPHLLASRHFSLSLPPAGSLITSSHCSVLGSSPAYRCCGVACSVLKGMDTEMVTGRSPRSQ